MANVQFIKGSYENIQNKSISDGQLLFSTDTGEIFLDTTQNGVLTRIAVGGKIDNENDIITGTISSSSWTPSSDNTGAYTSTYTNENIKDQFYLIYHPDPPTQIPPATVQWNHISGTTSTNGSLIFSATYGIPNVDLTFVAIPK